MNAPVEGNSNAPCRRRQPTPSADDPRLAVLTQRELEVARKIADGASNKEVARDLDITERTVKAHAGAIFEKLGARDRLHLSLIVHGRERRPSEASRSVLQGGR
jgi:DNA-binding NarL/FixJ family response regulator